MIARRLWLVLLAGLVGCGRGGALTVFPPYAIASADAACLEAPAGTVDLGRMPTSPLWPGPQPVPIHNVCDRAIAVGVPELEDPTDDVAAFVVETGGLRVAARATGQVMVSPQPPIPRILEADLVFVDEQGDEALRMRLRTEGVAEPVVLEPIEDPYAEPGCPVHVPLVLRNEVDVDAFVHRADTQWSQAFALDPDGTLGELPWTVPAAGELIVPVRYAPSDLGVHDELVLIDLFLAGAPLELRESVRGRSIAGRSCPDGDEG